MPKNDNFIKILDMLDAKQKITVKDIVDSCDISRRTAYRYVDIIKKSSLPINISRSFDGISLTKKHKNIYHDISINDMVYIITGLKLLGSLSNSYYRKEIDKIINGIIKGSELNLNEVIDIGMLFHKSKVSSKDIHLILTQAFLKIGTIYDIPVSVIKMDEDRKVKKNIGKVSMYFNREWVIQSKQTDGQSAIPLTDVYYAGITE